MAEEIEDKFPGRAREQVGRVLEMLASMGTNRSGLAWVLHPCGHALVRGDRELMIARDLVLSSTLGWTLGVLADAALDGVSVAKRIDRAADLLARALLAPPEGHGGAGDGGSGDEAFAGLA